MSFHWDLQKAKSTFYSILAINNCYARYTYDSIRPYLSTSLYFSSTFIQRNDVTNADQHTTATRGNGAALTAQVWKPLALKTKDLLTFSNSHSFVIYCYCFLLSISEASHTAQNTQYVEKYYCTWQGGIFLQHHLHLIQKYYRIHYWTSKPTNKRAQQESRRFFKGSVLGVTLIVHAPEGVRPPKQPLLLTSHCLPIHVSSRH